MIIALFAFAVSVVVATAALLAHQTRTLDARFEKIDARFEKVDSRFEKIDTELGEIKVAVARLEGPLPKLQRL
ncbi:hypothetical protein DY023_16270 [Microbacterium bovistercoris]|uniref:Uncharacterized protein n=2 Tax=Microbacterium bovistercoris TaxID=2293570 RepID=A0A371NPR5_9MICO|nr:hypothetical protein DY023_16270 [Microbacterium bovistercoris]